MIKEKIRLQTKIIIVLIVLVSMTLETYAFGISSPYWGTSPLEMFPGETKFVELTIHNVDDNFVKVKANLIEGNEIAKLNSNEYTIPPQSSIKVGLVVSIPEDNPRDSTSNVKISFREVKVEKGGMVQLASGIDTSFPVIIKQPIAEEVEMPTQTIKSITNITLFILILLIIIIGYFMIKRKDE